MPKMMVIHCDKCNAEMECGEVAYRYREDVLCENCFESALEEARDEAPFTISEDDCEYDGNEGCFSRRW